MSFSVNSFMSQMFAKYNKRIIRENRVSNKQDNKHTPAIESHVTIGAYPASYSSQALNNVRLISSFCVSPEDGDTVSETDLILTRHHCHKMSEPNKTNLS